jgi:hypothetical protein
VKTRTLILKEGKGFIGIGFRRGLHSIKVFNDIYATEGRIKILFNFDAFFLRTVFYTRTRIWDFCISMIG